MRSHAAQLADPIASYLSQEGQQQQPQPLLFPSPSGTLLPAWRPS